MNAIAAATAQRIPDMPNTPTFTEAGLPFVYDSWFGLMAPHGVPKPILDKISKDKKYTAAEKAAMIAAVQALAQSIGCP